MWWRTCGLAMACRDLGHASPVLAVSFLLPGWQDASYRLSDAGTGTMWLVFTQERWVSLAVTGNCLIIDIDIQGLNTEVEMQNGTRIKAKIFQDWRSYGGEFIIWSSGLQNLRTEPVLSSENLWPSSRLHDISQFESLMTDSIERVILRLPICKVHIT